MLLHIYMAADLHDPDNHCMGWCKTATEGFGSVIRHEPWRRAAPLRSQTLAGRASQRVWLQANVMALRIGYSATHEHQGELIVDECAVRRALEQ